MLRNNVERFKYYNCSDNWEDVFSFNEFLRLVKLKDYPIIRVQLAYEDCWLGRRFITFGTYKLKDSNTLEYTYVLTDNQVVSIMRSFDNFNKGSRGTNENV